MRGRERSFKTPRIIHTHGPYRSRHEHEPNKSTPASTHPIASSAVLVLIPQNFINSGGDVPDRGRLNRLAMNAVGFSALINTSLTKRHPPCPSSNGPHRP